MRYASYRETIVLKKSPIILKKADKNADESECDQPECSYMHINTGISGDLRPGSSGDFSLNMQN